MNGNGTGALKQAYLTIQRLERKLAEHEGAAAEPIAIVGAGCRLPGGVTDLDSYWRLLIDGVDAVRAVPEGRWDGEAFRAEAPSQPGRVATAVGGFLDGPDGIEDFDHDFFGISKREAVDMDPQQRLALEVAWEALEHAGRAPDGLAGRSVGVYLGVCGNDYATRLFADPAGITAHTSTGTAHSVLAGRISYLLDLRGPSVAVDTACSSSLVAVHQAAQSLRSGECEEALAGGVNVLLEPHSSIAFSQFPDMLATDGRCKTFDASANGYVRGEGAGIVVLKRLSDARRDGDRVLAVLRGSAVNQDGRSAGVTAPNGAAQRDVLRQALRSADMEPERVGYLETHGTGTKLGDPIEVEALSEVYGRPDGEPVRLGSVKTNIGHLESAAGVAGLLKAVLCLRHGRVPANLHFRELNPHISLDGTTFTVPAAATPWPRRDDRRAAAVSSFGFSGTNAHVVLEEAVEEQRHDTGEEPGKHVLTLSARTPTALTELARRYRDRLAGTEDGSTADLCRTAATGRTHTRHRLAVVAATRGELGERLGEFVAGDCGGCHTGTATRRGDVAFLFTGQGSLYRGMGGELYRTHAVFREEVERCDALLQGLHGRSLLPVLTEPDGDAVGQDVAQPALFAVEYAAAQLWRSWGVEPAAVFGHSLGEYVAACVAGVLSLPDAVRLVAERGRALAGLPETGEMAAVFASREAVAELIGRAGAERVSVAAVNGGANIAVSGDAAGVAAVCEAAAADGVETERLRVDTPFHSPLVEPALAGVRAAAADADLSPPRIPFVSGLTGAVLPWDRAVDAEHWVRHTREPVLFADGMTALNDLGCTTFVEAGPTSTLLGLAAQALLPGTDALLLPTMRPRHAPWDVLLDSVSRLYVHGGDVDWDGFHRHRPRTVVDLPFSVFERVRCWRDPVTAAPGAAQPPGPESSPAADVHEAGGPEPAGTAPAEDALPLADDVLAEPSGERVELLTAALVRRIATRLGTTSAVVPDDEPLNGMGLDSLMAVELKNEIQARLGVALSVTGFLKGATVTDLAGQIVTRLESLQGRGGAATGSIRRAARTTDSAEELLKQIDELSEEQLQAMTRER